MATKKYNQQFFTLQENNNTIVFHCYTTNTKNGFCHTVKSLDSSLYGAKLTSDTKSSYLNRTWERYDYESTLKRACKKLGANINNIVRTY